MPLLIYFIIMAILTIALAPRPPVPKPGTITDFKMPTADQGIAIRVIFGQCKITGPNCVWYGDLATEPITTHSMFSTSTIGYQYYLGYHLVLGHGPFDSINQVWYDQKLVWIGNSNGVGGVAPISANGDIAI